MKLKKVIIVIVLLAMAVPMAVLASASDNVIENGETVDGDLIIRESTIVEEGAEINGDVTVLASDFELNGTVNGNVVVFGGDLIVDGAVVGDLVVFGGDISIDVGSNLNGDCILLGGSIVGQEHCESRVASELNLSTVTEFLTAADLRGVEVETSEIQVENLGFFGSTFAMALTAAIVGSLAYFVTSAVPGRMYEVRHAVSHNPYMTGGIGMLTAIAGSSFLILTSWIWIPLLLILTPILGLGVFLGFAGLFYLGAVVLMGWITVGALAAGRFVDQTDPLNPNDPIIAAMGSGILTFAFGMLWMALPVVTFLIVTALFFVGLGGVVLTRLGKQSFPRLPNDVNRDKFNKVMGTMPK